MTDDYDRNDDVRRSIEFAYRFIRARVASGGAGWREYVSPCGHSENSPSGSMRPGLTINVANRVSELPIRKEA